MVSTLKIYDILEQAQIDEKHARAITAAIERALDENNLDQARVLATKEDIAKLREESAKLRGELIEKIADAKVEIIRWMFIFWIGLIPIIAALIKFIR